MSLERLEQIVRRGIYYIADADDDGARVSTSLTGTICPHCGSEVQANIEHLCGNRVPGKKKGFEGKRNPTRGCSRISPGCVNCYAERQARRKCNADPRALS